MVWIGSHSWSADIYHVCVWWQSCNLSKLWERISSSLTFWTQSPKVKYALNIHLLIPSPNGHLYFLSELFRVKWPKPSTFIKGFWCPISIKNNRWQASRSHPNSLMVKLIPGLTLLTFVPLYQRWVWFFSNSNSLITNKNKLFKHRVQMERNNMFESESLNFCETHPSLFSLGSFIALGRNVSVQLLSPCHFKNLSLLKSCPSGFQTLKSPLWPNYNFHVLCSLFIAIANTLPSAPSLRKFVWFRRQGRSMLTLIGWSQS